MILIAAWFADGILRSGYVYYPRHAVAAEDKIVALAVKGVIVYITPGQRFFLSSLTWIEIVCILVIVIVFLIHGGDPFRKRK